MTRETGVRVVLEIIVDPVGDEEHGKNEHQRSNGNDDLRLIRKPVCEPGKEFVEQRNGIQGHFMLLFQEIFRFSVLMACCAFFFCLFGRHLPVMRFMTAFAGQVQLEMQLMFSDIRDIAVAFYQATAPVRPGLDMRVMAFIAIELHGGICRCRDLYGLSYDLLLRLIMLDVDGAIGKQFVPHRFIPVAEEAFLSSRPKVLRTVGMTIEAGKGAHGQASLRAFFIAGLSCFLMRPEFLVLVAGETVSLLHSELVCPVAMALGALDLFGEDMFRMVP
jgi:hypothetical protein